MAENRIGLEAVLLTDAFVAGVKTYNTGLDQLVKASSDASGAAVQQLTAYTDLAQELSNVGPAKLAATAIDRLQSEFAEGKISAGQYAAAVTQVQDEFGLVTPAGRKAVAALDALDKAFADGKIDAKEYASGLKQIKTAQDQSGKSAIELASKIDIAKNALAAAQKVIGTGLELAKLGAQAERVEQRFAAFAEEAGGADAVLRAFQEGAGGAASKMEAMTTASRLLQMGLVTNADEMSTVVEMATRLGDQTQSVTDRVSDFALLLANQSIPRLDNFGISSGKVRARIKELQEAQEGLSRETAFMQAVMEQGGQSLEKLGPRVDDNLTSFEKMEAQIADLKVEIGQGLVPAMVALLSVATDVLGIVSPLITQFGELAGGVDRASKSMEDATTATQSWSDEAQAMVDGGANMVEVTDTLAKRVNDATDAFHEDGNAVEDLITAYARGSKEAEVLGNAALDARKAIIQQADSAEEANRRITQWNETVTSSHARLVTMTAAQFEAAKSMDANREAAAEQEQMWADLEAQAEATGLSVQTLGLRMVAEQLNIETTTEAIDRETRARRSSANMATAQASRVEGIRAAQDAAAAAAQRVADAQARQIDIANRQAEAMAAAQAASDEFARSQAGLISSLEGATQEMFNQQVLAQIDPADVGLEAYTSLGIELGVLSQEQANLAASIPVLTQAFTDGIIPTENMAEATQALFEAAGDADFATEELLDKYARAPGLIGPSAEAAESLAVTLEATGESAASTAGDIDALTASVNALGSAIGSVPALPAVSPGEAPAFQQGGILPGPSTQAVPFIGHGTERIVPVGDIAGPTGPPMSASSIAAGTLGRFTQTTTNNTTEIGDTTVSIQVPNMLAAQMLSDSLEQSRRARFDQ